MNRFALAMAVVGLGLAVAPAAAAADVKAGALALSDLQVRASLGSNPNTAAYLTITNTGAAPDRLLSAACTCAAVVQIHRTVVEGGVARMAPAGGVPIPAKGRVSLRPGDLHIMVMGLKRALKDGGEQEFSLRFERAGLVKAKFHVTSRIAAAAHHH